MAQALLTVLIVACSTAYVLWALLLPAAAQRRVAQALLRLRWPAAVRARLQGLAQASPGCGCDGCDRRPAPPRSVPQPMHWAPRRKR
jgi:hypothetical protein